jgi:uncharacterized protein YbbC (DUF1343 family)
MEGKMLKGIDNILKYSELFQGKRIGLITSISGVDNKLNSTIEIIHKHFNLRALFGPEHGVRGDKEAGEIVENYCDEITGVPTFSLYRKDSKRLTKDMLDMIDILVYDIQDIGVRYYTFISTLIYALEDCAKEGKQLIVLDRPNPLGGTSVEGNVLEPTYKSFIGAYPIPTRYGLTVGELAHMVNEEQSIGCNLVVIPCTGWKRCEMFPQTGQIWVMPSLGIPRFETALLYTGTCLVEGTNLSEGRGTSCPFELIGAPYIKAHDLVEKLKSEKLEGVNFTPAYFTPTSSKHKGVFCKGVHIHITDYESFESYRTGIAVIEAIKELYPYDFEFLEPINKDSRPFISLLSGDNSFENKEWSCEEILGKNKKGLEEFKIQKEKYHIYK